MSYKKKNPINQYIFPKIGFLVYGVYKNYWYYKIIFYESTNENIRSRMLQKQ